MLLDDPHNPLTIEIRQEMAEAYFGACRKMLASLNALKAFDRAALSTPKNVEQITRRSELLDDAAERVHYVLIQREAMRLRHSAEFLEDCEVPAEVKARMGRRTTQSNS